MQRFADTAIVASRPGSEPSCTRRSQPPHIAFVGASGDRFCHSLQTAFVDDPRGLEAAPPAVWRPRARGDWRLRRPRSGGCARGMGVNPPGKCFEKQKAKTRLPQVLMNKFHTPQIVTESDAKHEKGGLDRTGTKGCVKKWCMKMQNILRLLRVEFSLRIVVPRPTRLRLGRAALCAVWLRGGRVCRPPVVPPWSRGGPHVSVSCLSRALLGFGLCVVVVL